MSLRQEQTFNDDLLLADEDRARAATMFPVLAHVFDFPELRSVFLRHDHEANRTKNYRRHMGLLAVVVGAATLAGAATSPLYHAYFSPLSRWPSYIGILFALLGVLSIGVGSFGVISAKPKVRWLSNRAITERLRQFYFQTLVCRMPDVLTSLTGAAERAEFLEQRRRWLIRLVQHVENHPVAQLTEIVEDEVEDDVWVLQPEPVELPDAIDPHMEQIFAAYRLFRLEHQRQYATYKVRRDERFVFNSAAWQHEWLRAASLFSILIILVVHLTIAISIAFKLELLAQELWLHVSVVWLAIIAIASRALEEGLQPAREVERYSHYRARLTRLLSQYDRATTPRDKHAVMCEMEQLVYQELRGFLKLHEQARFAL